MSLEFFAGASRATEGLLAAELAELGAAGLKESGGGVYFTGTLETAYRACLWSRVASRIYLRIGGAEAGSYDELYETCRRFPWNEHMRTDDRFAVSATKSGSPLNNTKLAALKVKDAIVDSFRDRTGSRPDVDTRSPDVLFSIHLAGTVAEISIDLSGTPLHRRSYRTSVGEAPIKENVAAALLLRARWPETAAAGGAFVDPMCGSGTLLIEAAMIAGDIAPGLGRERFGFQTWPGHDEPLFRTLVGEAGERRRAGIERIPPILGFDRDPKAVRSAAENTRRAGLDRSIRVTTADFAEIGPACRPLPIGLVALNPPYGHRIGSETELKETYHRLGKILIGDFPGWRASVLTSSMELSKSIGLRAWHVNTLYNGPLRCVLAHFEIHAQRSESHPGTEMLENRLRKNLGAIGEWADSQGISCFRLYDADMPEYSAAIDIYEKRWVHVQEYAAPPTVDPDKAEKRFHSIVDAVSTVLGTARDDIFVKRRERQRGTSQYGKLAESGVFYEAHESVYAFLVNFTDYLDTGLFLDHRITRSMVRSLADGTEVLNLFSYTGSFSVYAAGGEAKGVTSVDLSNTYLSWARENMTLNGFSDLHYRYIRADCRDWLIENRDRRRYGLVVLDPPAFSNSKAMRGTLDIQRDHAALIRDAMAVVEDGGVLLFSTPRRKFDLDASIAAEFRTEEITAKTIPEDFARKRPHRCWLIYR